MSYSVTIFDTDGNPMANQPVDLLQNGSMLAQATTDPHGVAVFAVPFESQAGLAIRSNPTPVSK